LGNGREFSRDLAADAVNPTIYGEPGRVYRIEATEQLLPLNWSTIGLVTNREPTVRFSERRAEKSRFYRVGLER